MCVDGEEVGIQAYKGQRRVCSSQFSPTMRAGDHTQVFRLGNKHIFP